MYSNSNPLAYVLTTTNVDATGHHWVASLATYNFEVCYRSGKSNVEADALSRIKWDQVTQPDAMKAIINMAVGEHIGLVMPH